MLVAKGRHEHYRQASSNGFSDFSSEKGTNWHCRRLMVVSTPEKGTNSHGNGWFVWRFSAPEKAPIRTARG